MFEKDMTVGLLLDFYGDVLSEHTRSLLSMYYAEDLSLAEIAADVGISRQGVRQAIKKGEDELRFLEKKLGLAAQFAALRRSADAFMALAPALAEGDTATAALAREALRCARVILSDTHEKESTDVRELNR